MNYDIYGRKTTEEVNVEKNIFKLPPGQTSWENVELKPGEFINPGIGANNVPNEAVAYTGISTGVPKPKFDDVSGTNVAQALYSFFPQEVQEAYAKEWIKFGEPSLALAATRNTDAWKNEFKVLKRPDGSFRMTELEYMSNKASFRETLSEVGITDFKDFEDDFDTLIENDVKPSEFNDRINAVWGAVKENIPQVEELFRTQYNIDSNEPTIFAALINPKIQDRLLKGELTTLGVAAEAKVAGFTNTFEHFDALRKAGLTQEGARQVYQQAGTVLGMGTQTGTAVGLDAIEQAAIGDKEAGDALQLLSAESKAMSSASVGAARKDKKYTGLVQD